MEDQTYLSADGVSVVLRRQNWTSHIHQRHPEVTLLDIAETLGTPHRICDHRDMPS